MVTVTKWRDRRDIYCLSTKHINNFEPMGGNYYKPKIIVDYNKGKSKIDLSDQMSSYSNPLRRSLKWYRKIAFDILLSVSVVTALSIYKTVTNHKTININEFKEEIVRKLFSECAEDIPRISLEILHNFKKNNKKLKCKGCYRKLVEAGDRAAAQRRCKKVFTFCDKCNESMCHDFFIENHKHIIQK